MENTRKAWNNLKQAWRQADDDTRFEIACKYLGCTIMATSMVANFGWSGTTFCIGLFLWTLFK